MREDDLDAVYKIETETFSNPWLREFFEIGLQHDSFVAEKDNEIAGYICALQVLDECTITNIAVRTQNRRQGIAVYMIKNVEEMMDKRDVRYYYLEVRASNVAAQALYHKLGYGKVGIRKDYYHHPTEDAIVMSLDKSGFKSR
ncbi:MAG: ribosomal protein S18-alanine N-acetyltransferase [Candidatus Cloacimonadaceae bacterium]